MTRVPIVKANGGAPRPPVTLGWRACRSHACAGKQFLGRSPVVPSPIWCCAECYRRDRPCADDLVHVLRVLVEVEEA